MKKQKTFVVAFQLDRLTIFEVSYNHTGNNPDPYFSTSVDHFIKNKRDFDCCGQCQEDYLPKFKAANTFYSKWNKKHLMLLLDNEVEDLIKDLDVLKQHYNYIERTDSSSRLDISFYQIVELSKQKLKKFSK